MSDNQCFFGVNSESVDNFWDKCKPLIQQALNKADDKFDLNYVYKKLTAAEMQLWVGFKEKELELIVITQIINYPLQRRCLIFALAGKNMNDWFKYQSAITDWASLHKCTKLEIYGRPGWERLLVSKGYEKIHTVMALDLSKGFD